MISNLVIYTEEGATSIEEEPFHNILVIINGDINLDFSTEETGHLIDFLDKKLLLRMPNSPMESTERYRATIDAGFTRYLENLNSRT